MQKWSNPDISRLQKLNDNLSALIEFKICYVFFFGEGTPHPASYFLQAQCRKPIVNIQLFPQQILRQALFVASMDVESLAFPLSSNICEVERHSDASLNTIMFSTSINRHSSFRLILISNISPQKVTFESSIG